MSNNNNNMDIDQDGGKRRKLKSGLKEKDFYCVVCKQHRKHRSEKNYCHEKYVFKTKNGLERSTFRLVSDCKVCKHRVGKFVSKDVAMKYPECSK